VGEIAGIGRLETELLTCSVPFAIKRKTSVYTPVQRSAARRKREEKNDCLQDAARE
jgi:hypothetical protein